MFVVCSPVASQSEQSRAEPNRTESCCLEFEFEFAECERISNNRAGGV